MAPGSKNGVLLVENRRDLAETVGTYLEASRYIVDYAADGLTAMHLAVTEKYDVIVLDVMFPGVDRMVVCRRLRKDARVTVRHVANAPEVDILVDQTVLFEDLANGEQ